MANNLLGTNNYVNNELKLSLYRSLSTVLDFQVLASDDPCTLVPSRPTVAFRLLGTSPSLATFFPAPRTLDRPVGFAFSIMLSFVDCPVSTFPVSLCVETGYASLPHAHNFGALF